LQSATRTSRITITTHKLFLSRFMLVWNNARHFWLWLRFAHLNFVLQQEVFCFQCHHATYTITVYCSIHLDFMTSACVSKYISPSSTVNPVHGSKKQH
jgi:hypothetical protein